MMKITSCILRFCRNGAVLMLLSGGLWLNSANAYEVSVQSESSSAGAVDISSDVAYSIKDGDCLIRWHAIQRKSNKQSELRVTRQCNKSFADQASYHEDILERINQDIPISSFSTLSWGGFTYGKDYSWVLPIALAADKSETYQDYRQNYPAAKVNNINQIFVELANNSRSYQPLADLFYAYGVTLTLDSVEKVAVSKAGKLPFYDELKEKRVGKNISLIYDAGMTYFQLTPLKP